MCVGGPVLWALSCSNSPCKGNSTNPDSAWLLHQVRLYLPGLGTGLAPDEDEDRPGAGGGGKGATGQPASEEGD